MRQVSEKDGKEYANSIDALFFETSATTNKNVSEVFFCILESLNCIKIAIEAKKSLKDSLFSERHGEILQSIPINHPNGKLQERNCCNSK